MIRMASGPVLRRVVEHHRAFAIHCTPWLTCAVAVMFALATRPTAAQKAGSCGKKKERANITTVSAKPPPSVKKASPPKRAALAPRRARPSKRTSVTPMPMANPDGPQPKWACEETEVVMEPMWQGGSIQCIFKIRNEGKSDLTIRAKGG